MHSLELPAEIIDRLRSRRGKLHLFESLDPRRTALVVIDMQKSVVEPGAPSAVATAREIVPNINRAAAALRAKGCTVAWVQATYTREGPGYWPLFFDYMDTTIKTLADTGRDMGAKYKETSEGGLAANLVLC